MCPLYRAFLHGLKGFFDDKMKFTEAVWGPRNSEVQQKCNIGLFIGPLWKSWWLFLWRMQRLCGGQWVPRHIAITHKALYRALYMGLFSWITGLFIGLFSWIGRLFSMKCRKAVWRSSEFRRVQRWNIWLFLWITHMKMRALFMDYRDGM